MRPSIQIFHVTAEDLRLRLFGPMREVSHQLLDKIIHYDPACAMAFIAVARGSSAFGWRLFGAEFEAPALWSWAVS
jgi:hypothetical protein